MTVVVALLDSATQRMSTVETHFGYEGSREAFVERLMHGAPQGSVIQFEHTEREEEEIFGPLSSRYSHEHGSTVDDSAMLNFDTVSEKVISLTSRPGLVAATSLIIVALNTIIISYSCRPHITSY